jgi:hypothetical protein
MGAVWLEVTPKKVSNPPPVSLAVLRRLLDDL